MSSRKKWWYDVIPYTIFSLFITIALFCKPPMEYPCFIGTLSCIILKVTPTFLTAVFAGLAIFFACLNISEFSTLMCEATHAENYTSVDSISQQSNTPIKAFGNTLIFFASVNVITLFVATLHDLFKLDNWCYGCILVWLSVYSWVLFVYFIRSFRYLIDALDIAITECESKTVNIDSSGMTIEIKKRFR